MEEVEQFPDMLEAICSLFNKFTKIKDKLEELERFVDSSEDLTHAIEYIESSLPKGSLKPVII